ncbi:MAG TPA: DUF433 domain-containing protein [Allosphingosinicella sp.]|nr:DUF433 domain-containing protein [Allosphingosinicella sp.]
MTGAGHPRIVSDPRICGGRPTVSGTRMRVSDVLEMLAGGASEAEIVADFPYLNTGTSAPVSLMAFRSRARDRVLGTCVPFSRASSTVPHAICVAASAMPEGSLPSWGRRGSAGPAAQAQS